MKIYRKSFTLSVGAISLFLTSCGPTYNTHFSEFSGTQSCVLNNNSTGYSLWGGKGYLNAATAGNYVIIMYNPKESIEGSLKKGLKVQVSDQQGHIKQYTGIADWSRLPDKKHIEFAEGLIENKYNSVIVGNVLYSFHSGHEYVLAKKDFVEIINGKKVKFIFEITKGSHHVEYLYEEMEELRNFALKCGLL